MHSLLIRALGLCLLMFFINALKAEEIDWVYESAKTARAILQEHDDHRNHELVHDYYAPGFVYISSSVIIEGDFEALEEYAEKKVDQGHSVAGPPHAIATCENTALIWKKLTIYDKDFNEKEGTLAILYEYIDGKAKIKFYHSTF